jgi:DNA invertase Pin-like site-specific DNA recombinase
MRDPENGNGKVSALIYCRISKDSEKRGIGVRIQEEKCRELCERRGFTVANADVYVENDISASDFSRKKRPLYEEMLDKAASGEYGAIVSYHHYRLTRRISEWLDLMTRLANVPILVEFCTSPSLDLKSAMGKAAALNGAVWSKLESDLTSERVIENLADRKKRGLPHGGNRQYGYRHVKGNIEIVPHEAEVIQDCAQKIIKGVGLNSVTKWLNVQGESTSMGKKWRAQTLRRILTSPTLIGMLDENTQGTWEAILDRATHVRLTGMLAKRGASPNAAPWQLGEYLLSGVLLCGRCKAEGRGDVKMSHTLWSKGRTSPQYTCVARSLGGCNGVAIKASDADEYVAAQVFARLSTIAFPVPAENTPQAPDTTELDRLRAEKRETLLNVRMPLADKEVVVEALNIAIEAEQAKVNAHIVDDEATMWEAEVREQLIGMTEGDYFSEVGLEDQRRIIGLVTERIEILPSPIRRHVAPPKDRVRITFREF